MSAEPSRGGGSPQRRYGEKLTTRSPLKDGSWLLIPDAAATFGTKVTNYLGYFSDTDDESERWEVTDDDGHVHRVDARMLYEGMGYSTEVSDPHMHEKVLRVYEDSGDASEGMVVAYMPPGETEEDNAIWLIVTPPPARPRGTYV